MVSLFLNGVKVFKLCFV